jgi:hypothetical protein
VLVHDAPKDGADERWSEKVRDLRQRIRPEMAARIDAMSVWASEVGDWFRGVIELLPQEMPPDHYISGMASLFDPTALTKKR